MKRVRKYHCFIILFFFVIFISCEKEIQFHFSNNIPNVIVVDGIITSEFKHQIIKLSYPVAQLNQVPKAVSGANVIVSTDDSVYFFTEQPNGSGIYISNNLFAGYENKLYSLQIYYNGKEYNAKSIMPEGKLFLALRYSKNSNNDLYHIDWVANSYSSDYFAMYEILIDWSHLPEYQNYNPDSCRKKIYYYTLPSIDVNQIIAPGKEKISFPAGTIITERRYSLTREHANYFRALLLETTWQGGLFDIERANVPTNLSSGAIGFFGASAINEISLIVNPQKNNFYNKGITNFKCNIGTITN